MQKLWATEITINRRDGIATIVAHDFNVGGIPPRYDIVVPLRCPKSVSNKELVRRALHAASNEEREVRPGPYLRYSWTYGGPR